MQTRTDKLFNGLSVQTIITFVMGVLEIVVFAIISRLLTKSDFGYYAAVSGIIAIFMSISEAGLGSAVIQKKDAPKRFISTAFTLSCIICLIMSLLLVALAPQLARLVADETLVLPLRIMAVSLFFHGIVSVGNGILYRQLNFKAIGIINVLSYSIASAVSIAMAAMGFGLYAVVALSVLHTVLSSLFLFVKVKFPAFSIGRQEAKEIASFGGWLTMGVILNNLTNQLDKLLLPKWISIEILGAYNRPAGFVSTITTKINGIFDTVLFPILSDLQNDKKKVSEVFLRAISLLNSFSVVLAAVFIFNADLIIRLFFGENWLELVPIMQIVSVSVIFNIDGRLVDCFFRSLALVRLGFFLRLLSAIITFASIYVGCKYGMYGVAISLVVSNVINILIKVTFLALKTKTSIGLLFWNWFVAWKPIIPILFIGIPFLIWVPQTWATNIAFALLFGFVAIIEFGFMPKLIGEEYTKSVYPKIEALKNKIGIR